VGGGVYNAVGALMNKKPRQEVPEAGALAFMFVALVLVFTGLGYLADRWMHTGPWLMVAGVFVGAGIGFTYLVYILFAGTSGRRRHKKTSDQNDEPGERLS
jgi:F0F1-type ATP synthase assembly protein I